MLNLPSHQYPVEAAALRPPLRMTSKRPTAILQPVEVVEAARSEHCDKGVPGPFRQLNKSTGYAVPNLSNLWITNPSS